MRKDLEVLKVWDAHKLLEWRRPYLYEVMAVRPRDSRGDPVVLAEVGTDIKKLEVDMQIEKRDEMAVNIARVIGSYSREDGFLSLIDGEGYDRETEMLAWQLWENGVVFYGNILNLDYPD